MKGWRPLLRIARRDALRHKGRSLLIVAMVAVPVAAMSASLTLGRSVERTPEQSVSDTMGQADLEVIARGVSAGDWQAVLPAGSRTISVQDDYGDVALVSGDELFEPSLFVADLADPLVAGMAELVSGRAARGPGEVVVSPSLAEDLGVGLGERLDLARPDRSVTVVGTAVRPFAVNLSSLFVPPGWTGKSAGPALGGHSIRWLVDVGAADPAGVGGALEERFLSPFPSSAPGATVMVPETGFEVAEDADYVEASTRTRLLEVSSEAPSTDEVSVTYVAGVLALVWTGGVAAAAFAVGARRRLREVGLVAATGGAPRHLRRMLVADGLVLGLAGGLGGVVLGLVVAAVARPHLDRLVGYAVDDLRIPLALLVGAAAAGCVAAVLAALAPARSASRVPVLAALAGRRPARARTRSWLAVGVVSLVVGIVLAWQGGGNGSEAAVNAGVLLVVVGVAATTAPLLVLVAHVAGAAPLTLRLAARDAGRARSRTGPATVAAMLGLAGAVGGSAMFQSYEAQAQREHVAFLREDQLSVRFTEARPAEAEVDAVLAAAVGAVPGGEGALLSAVTLGADGPEVFSGPEVPHLGAGVDLGAGGVANGPQPGSLLAVGDVAALDVMGASEAVEAFEAGRIVALNGGTVDDGGTVTLRTIDEGELQEQSTIPAFEVEGQPLFGLPNYLMSAATAESLGLTTQPSSVVLRAPEPVTDADVRRVNLAVLDAVPSVPVFTARESPQGAGALVVPVMLGAGALVALFVVALVTALSREELRPHLATLAAAGAAPRTRRRLAAAQSGLLAGLAAVLAVPAGLIPAVTLLRARSADVEVSGSAFVTSLSSPPVVVPWLAIAALVVGVTLMSAAGGGLFTRTSAHTTC
jgi:putative ABC transport system permease protein